MNKYIKEQLQKVKVCKLPPIKDDSIVIHIKRQSIFEQEESTIEVNNFYLIKLENYILNPPPGFKLHENWNSNIKPTQTYYKCRVLQKMGKMIKIIGVGFDFPNKKDLDDEVWEGWLPMKSVEVIAQI